jgi:shikimate kinase
VIAFVGLPGSGKSTVGRQLARRLDLPFIDSDPVIEQRIGCSIREYFEREGEDCFRDVEEAVIDELTQTHQGVLSTGGGSPLRAVNRQRLRSRGLVIYLCSSPEELFRRLRRDRNRPLLQVSDPLVRLRDLYTVRDPLYREVSHYVVESGRPSVAALVASVLAHLERTGMLPRP